jgi:hypothetical protein
MPAMSASPCATCITVVWFSKMLSTLGFSAAIFGHACSIMYWVSEYGLPVSTDTAAIRR